MSDPGPLPPGEDFEAFFRRTYTSMLSRAMMLSGRRPDAEDAVQHAYIEAWRCWDKVRGFDYPDAWVYRVTARRLSKLKPASAVLISEQDLPPSPRSGPEQVAEVREVLRLLDKLPSRQRAAIVLYCVYGLPQQEIAELLGISRGAVAHHLHVARVSLEKSLGLPAARRRQDLEGFMTADRRAAGGIPRLEQDPLTVVLRNAEAAIRDAIGAGHAERERVLAAIKDEAFRVQAKRRWPGWYRKGIRP